MRQKGDMVVWAAGSSQLNSCLGVTKGSDTFVYKKVQAIIAGSYISHPTDKQHNTLKIPKKLQFYG